MKRKFEAVKNENGIWAVKTQIRKNGHWYTAAETFCVPGLFDAKEMADTVANALNFLIQSISDRRIQK